MGEKKETKHRSVWKKLKEKVEAFGNKAKYAVVGIGHCLRRPKYAIVCVLGFILFLYILTFFRDGNGNWQLLWSGIDSGKKLMRLGRVFGEMFANFTSLYGILLVLMSALQALALTQIIYTWRNRHKSDAMSGVGHGGVASLLGFAAMGCPSCGFSFLTPFLSAIAGTSASILAERIGIILAIIAFGLLIYANINLGYIVFIIAGSRRKES